MLLRAGAIKTMTARGVGDWRLSWYAHRVQDSIHGRSPAEQVIHVKQRVQWRLHNLDLVREEVVLVATPTAVLSAWQHLAGKRPRSKTQAAAQA